MQISRLPKQNGARPRTVVITQGQDPTIVAYLNKARPRLVLPPMYYF